jgi:hypothetical protein
MTEFPVTYANPESTFKVTLSLFIIPERVVFVAIVKYLSPGNPVGPVGPVDPVPIGPIGPVDPVDPVIPVGPVVPV